MNVDVIVIDSGCGYFQKDNVLGGINLCDDGESNFYDNIGHGSAVIDIIMEQNPNSTFFIIKTYLFDEENGKWFVEGKSRVAT